MGVVVLTRAISIKGPHMLQIPCDIFNVKNSILVILIFFYDLFGWNPIHLELCICLCTMKHKHLVKNHVPVSETLLAPPTLFEHSTDIGLTSKSKVTYFIFHFVHQDTLGILQNMLRTQRGHCIEYRHYGTCCIKWSS